MTDFSPTHTLINAIQDDGVVYHAGTPVDFFTAAGAVVMGFTATSDLILTNMNNLRVIDEVAE